METFIQDTRYAIRQLTRAWSFTVVVVLTLALGIGLNVAAFTVINGLLFRPLPVDAPEQLAYVYTSEWSADGVSGRRFGATAYPDFVDFRTRSRSFSGLMAYTDAGFRMREGDDEQVIAGAHVSGNYFDVLGTRPHLGRFFADNEDDIASPVPVAVLSHRMWKTRFGEDPSIVGREVELDGRRFTIIGVTRPEVLGADVRGRGAVFVPFAMRVARDGRDELVTRDARGLRLVGRLQPGVSLAAAEAELNGIMKQLASDHPTTNADRVLTVTSARTLFSGMESSGQVGGVAASVVALTMLVLCVTSLNVANLLVARGARRRRELAIRAALGAARWRLLRQLLTESALLVLAGAVVAVLGAMWSFELVRLAPLPFDLSLPFDARVIAMTAGASLVALLVFGLAPALQSVRASVGNALKDGSGGAAQRSRLRGALVGIQVALSLVLLVVSGLFVRTLLAATNVDPGFATRDVLVAHIIPVGDNPAQWAPFLDEVMTRTAGLPGVQSVSLAAAIPLSGGARRYITVPGYVRRPNEDMEIPFNVVSSGYLRTLGIPLVRGRDFVTHSDQVPQVIVNETFAKRFWPDQNPIGKRVFLGNEHAPSAEVVGVARDARYRSLNEPALPYFYIQWPQGGVATALTVRVSGPLDPVASAIRREVQSLDGRALIENVQSLDEVLHGSLMARRLAALAIGSFGALALLLASLGLYGLQAFLVAERTREIGVRLALGADATRVVRLVLREGLRVVALGAVAGIPLALIAGRIASRALFGIRPEDPVTYAAVVGVLALVALSASWWPARRAARVDPVIALRHE